MLYLAVALSLAAGAIAATLILIRRRLTPVAMILMTLPALASGAAGGHWPAFAALTVVVAAVLFLRWADARWPARAE